MKNTSAQDVINTIRSLGQVLPADIAAITAALSCQIAADVNKHIPLHEAAVDSLDDLSNYINESIEVTA